MKWEQGRDKKTHDERRLEGWGEVLKCKRNRREDKGQLRVLWRQNAKGWGTLPGGNMRMACGEEWTGSECVRCTELRLWLGMLLLPPGLANHKFCKGHGKRKVSE